MPQRLLPRLAPQRIEGSRPHGTVVSPTRLPDPFGPLLMQSRLYGRRTETAPKELLRSPNRVGRPCHESPRALRGQISQARSDRKSTDFLASVA